MIEETSAVNKQPLDPPPPLCHLPFDLVEEILCILPVKILLQIRCVCKSWNSLISNPRFINKHLNMSSTTTARRYLHCLTNSSHPLFSNTITSCPLHSTASTMPSKVTYLKYPSNIFDRVYPDSQIVGSCNGILCIAQHSTVMVWNPSINKVKKLPPFQELPNLKYRSMSYGFGYDLATGKYKVVSVLAAQVKVNTLGTNFWKNIQNFPFDSIPDMPSGKFVSGTINWLASKCWEKTPCFIVSLDLGTDSYHKILSPDCEELHSLSVLRDCLCVISDHDDIWIMKEYGNKESWTKLYTVRHLAKALYIFEADQVLLESWTESWGFKLVVYYPKINRFMSVKFENNYGVFNPKYYGKPEVYVESLIWPYS